MIYHEDTHGYDTDNGLEILSDEEVWEQGSDYDLDNFSVLDEVTW